MSQFATLKKSTIHLNSSDEFDIKRVGNTDGYDGHCLRAYYYFGDQMSGIEENPDSINTIEDLYPDLRQDSKPATFALTYQGTWQTLVNNLGWSEEKSKQVEKAYHDLYYESDAWVQEHIKNAHNVGYVTGAFGLRIRTPRLAKTVYDSSGMPYEAQKEQRTAGNALGQSWGLLNNRAAIELSERLKNKPEYRTKILPISHIHDAQYFLVRNDADVIHWLNENAVECMQWQEHPDIQHDEVKLGGQVSIFYPSWAYELKLPNNASVEEISTLCSQHLSKLKEEGIL